MNDIVGTATEGTQSALQSIEPAAAPEWVMLTLALVMFGGWTATYVATIRKARRDEAYGIPVLNTSLNFSWELIFSLNIMGGLPRFIFPLQAGHLFWLIPNAFNVWQTFKFGPRIQKNHWIREHFRVVFAATMATSFFLLVTFQWYARDIYGVASSWVINVLMSWMFIRMLMDRRDQIASDQTIKGISLPAAWFKLVGNSAGALFCVLWWPAQFAAAPGGVIVHAGISVLEPVSYAFLNLVYVLNIALDVAFIYFVMARQREIRHVAVSLRPQAAALT